MRSPWLVLTLSVFALASPAAAEAQVCRTGKPCGNTCIARNRVCRVGPGTARAGGTTTAPATTMRGSAASIPDGAQFVASSRGQAYYWIGCSAWRSLAQTNLRFYRSREEAEAAGLRPSTQQSCAGPGDLPTAEAPPGGAAPSAPVDADAPCTVSSVVDGDTLDCLDGRRVRLLLVDAPEMSQGAFGGVAKAALEGLTPVGSTVGVSLDVDDLDDYSRLLAYLHLADGRIVNEELVRMGVAVVSVYPPNVMHVDRFRAAGEEAQAQKRGLWALNAFECLPADHRAGRCR